LDAAYQSGGILEVSIASTFTVAGLIASLSYVRRVRLNASRRISALEQRDASRMTSDELIVSVIASFRISHLKNYRSPYPGVTLGGGVWAAVFGHRAVY
jgi:hypothetical protein